MPKLAGGAAGESLKTQSFSNLMDDLLMVTWSGIDFIHSKKMYSTDQNMNL
jgi:hypothetical protein